MLEVPAGHPEKPQGEDGFKLLERMNGGSHEELGLWGISFLPIADTDHVLDVGCGGGANIKRLLARVPRGHVTGVDYSAVSVQASSDHNAEAVEAGRCDVLEGN
ncbi:MAG: class I SAM-dependent methyltransferase, partial [Eggerthellaceae bacterium]|nr:class I SAM-dependent methyltransferase [Eggerthellaceae bacterium]